MNRKIGKVLAIGFAAAMAFCLSSCGGESREEAAAGSVSDGLGIDIAGGEEVSYSDIHGGFLGDGITYAAYRFADSNVREQIEESGEWVPLPMDEVAAVLAYGVTEHGEGYTINRGPYLTDEEQEPLLPEVENGYYRLIDRQMENGFVTAAMLERASLNFTLGIYDTDTDTLYYCEMDT